MIRQSIPLLLLGLALLAGLAAGPTFAGDTRAIEQELVRTGGQAK